MSFLPGHFPGAAAAAAGLTTLTQVESATSTSNTITGPAGIVAGDLLVLWDAAGDATVPATAVPTDFNIIANLTDGVDVRAVLSYKIADGSEASASLSGLNGGSEWKGLYVFRGNIPITTATPTDPESEITNGNPTAKTVNASGGTPPLVVVAGYFGGGAAVNPRTFTVGGVGAKDGEINPTTALYLAYKIYNSAPADVVIDMDDEGVDNAIAGCYIACS